MRAPTRSEQETSPSPSIPPWTPTSTCETAGGAAHLLRGSGRLAELLHHLVEAEARGLLARRELLEAREPARDIGLRRNEQVGALEPPHRVADRLVARALEGIRAQVEERRQA